MESGVVRWESQREALHPPRRYHGLCGRGVEGADDINIQVLDIHLSIYLSIYLYLCTYIYSVKMESGVVGWESQREALFPLGPRRYHGLCQRGIEGTDDINIELLDVHLSIYLSIYLYLYISIYIPHRNVVRRGRVRISAWGAAPPPPVSRPLPA